MTRYGLKIRDVIRIASIILASLSASALHANAQQKPPIDVTGYKIDAAIDPATHMLTAVTTVTFKALQPAPVVQFGLHGALNVDKVTDENGNALNGQRGPNATVLVTPPAPLNVGTSYTWTFSYKGALEGQGGPVPGLKLASVGNPISYLLYAGAWFPMVGYQTDRFTADIRFHVPSGYEVVGSGPVPVEGAPNAHSISRSSRGKKSGRKQNNRTTVPAESTNLPTLAVPPDTTEYDFKWDRPGFPGTIVAGKFIETSPAPNIHIFTTAQYKPNAEDYGQSTLRILAYFSSTFGLPESYNI